GHHRRPGALTPCTHPGPRTGAVRPPRAHPVRTPTRYPDPGAEEVPGAVPDERTTHVPVAQGGPVRQEFRGAARVLRGQAPCPGPADPQAGQGGLREDPQQGQGRFRGRPAATAGRPLSTAAARPDYRQVARRRATATLSAWTRVAPRPCISPVSARCREFPRRTTGTGVTRWPTTCWPPTAPTRSSWRPAAARATAPRCSPTARRTSWRSTTTRRPRGMSHASTRRPRRCGAT